MLKRHNTIALNPKSGIQGLYVITADQQQTPSQLVAQVKQAIRGGARVVQYRSKDRNDELRYQQALALRELCHLLDSVLIINDDAKLARQVDADGVHLGRNDGSISAARRLLGEQALIGISCYNCLDTAIEAEQAGADYVAFGSFYPSPTKPEAVLATLSLLEQARQRLSIPVVAIGGITSENGTHLIAAGASALAVISGVFGQSDITAAARAYARLFDNNPEP
jgi:thiamine-phosphate pyrophosphorylase